MHRTRSLPARICWVLITNFVLCAIVLWGQAAAIAKGGRDLSWTLKLSDRAKASLPARTKRAAVQKYGLKSMALRRCFVNQHNTRYKVQVPGSGQASQVRDQQYSGRCWIFASGRVLRSKTAKHVKNPPKLSTSFVNYHALRQVSRALLKEAYKSGAQASFDRVTEASEGGFQIWAMDIVRKHGFVPVEKMPFTKDGADPGVYLTHLQTLVAAAMRDFAKLDGKTPKTQRKAMLRDYQKKVDDLLSTTIGKPPRSFTYNGKKYSPRSFRSGYLQLGDADLDYVTLTNYPNRGWYRSYRNGDSPGFAAFEEYNLPMDVIQRAIKKTVRDGEAVLFGMNAADDHPYRTGASKHQPDKAKGILSVQAFRYNNFIPAPKISKRDSINAGISAADHAMVFTAYDPAGRSKVRKWRVENSHGPREGDKGHFHAYDDYVRQYLEDVVVPRSALPSSLQKKITAKPVLDRPEDRYFKGRSADLPTAIKSLRRLLK